MAVAANSNTYRVLVVDDNPAIHRDFQKVLERPAMADDLDAAGAQVFGEVPGPDRRLPRFTLDFASQGQEALQKVVCSVAEHRPYALAFMDVRMPPGWDGIETTSRIWEVAPDLQVVICTAYSDYSLNQITAKLPHPERFVVLKKPFDMIEVQQLANAFCEKWSLLSQVRQHTASLEESESRYRFLAEAMPDIVWTATSEGQTDYLNERFALYCGRQPEQMLETGWQEFVHPDDRANALEHWEGSLRTGKPCQTEFRLLRAADQTYRWHLTRAVPMRNAGGAVSRWIGTTTDIHDQKNAEQLLRQSQLTLERRVVERTDELNKTRYRLDRLLNSSPAIIYSIDRTAAGKISFISRNVTAILGLQPAELMATSEAWINQLHPEDVEMFSRCQQTLETRGTRAMDYRIRHRDGSYRWMHDEARVIGESEHSPGEIVGYCIDITPFKEAEQQRHRMEVQLRHAQKLEAIGQLAAGIAHEINTPTQYVGDNTRFLQDSFNEMQKVLKCYGDLLKAAKDRSVHGELLNTVEKVVQETDLDYLFDQIPAAIRETLEGVDRVTKIVRAMKEFSHPGGKEKAAADINRAIESTVTVARNEWKYVAELKLDLDPCLPPVPCYLGEFNQVILNLVINAAHAIADVVKENPGTKGLIEVATRRAENHVEIRVSDTGCGIPETLRPRIFEPFFTTKEVGKGSGQGLTIVYGSIVNKHGGTVRFDSEVGKGTSFIILLPLAQSKPEQNPSAIPEHQPAAL